MPTNDPVRSAYPWLSARARNALRRKMLASVSSAIVFVMVLVGLIMIPRDVIVSAPSESVPLSRPDTMPVFKEASAAYKVLQEADSALRVARAAAARMRRNRPTVLDTISPELREERDSLTAQLEELTRAMERAAASPLPSMFRDLANARVFSGNTQVTAWKDSLDRIEKLREPFSALGAGDPIYVSLTAHLNELGRSIRDEASVKRSELQARLAPLQPIPVPPSLIEDKVDTMRFLDQRNAVQRDWEIAVQVLNDMRAQNASIDSVLAYQRKLANVDAPPLAMFGGAIVIALFAGFSTVFIAEIKNPRLANKKEAETVSGVRVLAVIHPVALVERSRRQSDVDAPPLVDIVSDRYRVLYLHLTATDANIPTIVITGPEHNIVTTVATNIAAAAAYDARGVLLVDSDTARKGVSSILRIPDERHGGIDGLLNDTLDWAEAVTPVSLGRDRTLDVLVGDKVALHSSSSEAVEKLRNMLIRMEQRYDLIVIATPLSYAQRASGTILPVRDVILCAHLGETHLSEVRQSVRELQRVGTRVHGLVLWDEEAPRL